MLWANGLETIPNLQASHLCNNPKCKVLEHIIPETAQQNNSRKNCLVWIDCPHCPGKKIIVCRHEPLCVKYVPGYESMEDLIANGVCS